MIQKSVERKTTQALMPEKADLLRSDARHYRIYPFHALGPNKIYHGFDTLVDRISAHKIITIDGYVGVDWDAIRKQLDWQFKCRGLTVNWILTANFLKSSHEIDIMTAAYLGNDDSLWGNMTGLDLDDFFDTQKLEHIELDTLADINIILGVAATNFIPALHAFHVYIDLPKNELIYRMRAKSICNLGATCIENISGAYKRFYFVDWIVLNKHKKNILDTISIMADAQWPHSISWMLAEDLIQGMKNISQSAFRARPWFDPGVWAGDWMQANIPELAGIKDKLAWSFELIAPECGLVFESQGNLLEVSFDTLMFREAKAILGKHYDKFGSYFPIRFNFLDTFNGGNLSIQCHPALHYIQENFGEQFTQDESYYILDCGPDAKVYLGFNDDINPKTFKQALENSLKYGKEVEVEKYVQTFKSQKHALYLIPNQTIHSSGRNNLVLEISATPYIFTFKMYDWLQKDAEGRSRPINIAHAFKNLDFNRKGRCVSEELIAKPQVLACGTNWKLIHLPTHAAHYYDVHRLEFEQVMKIDLANTCHILMLVEGQSIAVETANGHVNHYNYAETFIVPAAAEHYTLTNKGHTAVKVIKAFLK